MKRKRLRSAPAYTAFVETLEGRIALSGIAPAASVRHAAEVSVDAVGRTTQTTLAVRAGTLGQPITFTVTVRAAAAAGSPLGTVQIADHGQVIHTLTLSPATLTNPKFAFSSATVTLTPQSGGSAYFFGKHQLTANFIPSGAVSKSKGSATFTVSKPAYTALANGVKIETITPGSGAAIQTGQTAHLLYTGYLASNGRIFDDSVNDGGAPIGFTIGAGQVIPGFNAGVSGMQVGESRIISIPPAQAYGRMRNGVIPPNSTLIFVATLESIS